MKNEQDKCKNNKPHVPDWSTLKITHDGGVAYVDVNCKECGRSGCVGSQETLETNICW